MTVDTHNDLDIETGSKGRYAVRQRNYYQRAEKVRFFETYLTHVCGVNLVPNGYSLEFSFSYSPIEFKKLNSVSIGQVPP